MLAPHSGLSSSKVKIIKITVELRTTIKRPYLGCLLNITFTKARLIRKAAMKFGKQPVKVLASVEWIDPGLNTSLFLIPVFVFPLTYTRMHYS